MNIREQTIELKSKIAELITAFETQTGMLVGDISINRAGCTESVPYRIYGIFLNIGPNSYWKAPTE